MMSFVLMKFLVLNSIFCTFLIPTASSFVPLPFNRRGYRKLLASCDDVNKKTPEIIFDPAKPHPPRGIIMVDPFSPYFSGYIINNAIEKYGIGIVNVFSPYSAKGIQARLEKNADDSETVENMLDKTAPLQRDELEIWLKSIPFDIVAVFCETDSGLDYAERLACAIDSCATNRGVLQHNGYSKARRDKYLMNQICADKGIPVVKQTLCRSTKDALQKALEFAVLEDDGDQTSLSTKVIIKPSRGVASSSVNLCSSPLSIKTATESIIGSTVFGTYDVKHNSVLMQEFIPGKEYAIDVVSKNGFHKIAALWVYDKTSTANDGTNPFSYICTRLVSSDDPCHPSKDIFSYVESILNALGMKWGLTHNEVKVTPDGKMYLIEVNARQHNTHFQPLCQACIGYNAFDLYLSAYLDGNDIVDGRKNEFEQTPKFPILKYSGAVVNLACFVDGEVTKVNHIKEIEEMESYVFLEMYPGYEVGSIVERTKDIRTDIGWIHLIHEDEKKLNEDCKRIRTLMRTMFEVK